MKKFITYSLVSGGSLLLGLGALFVGVLSTHANPSHFLENRSAVATTTVSFMTPGTGTTTNTFDTQSVAGTTGIEAPADSASLLIQFAGSTTASVLNVAIEYSQDNLDWYQDTLTASTTQPDIQAINPLHSFSLLFASSTVGGVAGATSTRIVNVKTPTRYVRAVFSAGIGSANGAVWSDFVKKTENR